MSEQSVKRISVWSGPRNVSTALMYSFAQRADTKVFDEPLYAHYLSSVADRPEHPGEQEILDAQENDGRRVVDRTLMADHGPPVLFFKNMAHHLVDLDWSFLDTVRVHVRLKGGMDVAAPASCLGRSDETSVPAPVCVEKLRPREDLRAPAGAHSICFTLALTQIGAGRGCRQREVRLSMPILGSVGHQDDIILRGRLAVSRLKMGAVHAVTLCRPV